MNESAPATLSSLNKNPDAIARRAFELWEREGCPDGCDLRHWLQAEKELETDAGGSSSGSAVSQNGESASTSSTRSAADDTTPLSGTRVAAAAGRAGKSGKRRNGGATM